MNSAAPLITDSWPLFQVMVWGHLVIYFAASVFLVFRGWPIAAGLVMLSASFMPLAGQVWFTDSEAKGTGLSLFLEAIPALGVILSGLLYHVFRLFSKK